MSESLQHTIAEIVHSQWGKLYASLVKWLRDFDLAEDVLQEALLKALESWPRDGIPEAPAAWLLTTAKRLAIDRIRRQKNFSRKSQQIALDTELQVQPVPEDVEMVSGHIHDERLRLIFTCCHPALAEPSRVALTLRTLGGLQTRDIARAFLVPEKTMQQRLVRAKAKIKKANIPFKVPDQDQWSERLDSVLAVIYLIFNEGYNASESQILVNADLCDEAVFLGRMLLDLVSESSAVMGLLALMLLHDSRRHARYDDHGNYITLEEQNRGLYCTEKINEGRELLEKSFEKTPVSAYQLQAAISALHVQAPRFVDTDWKQISFLYNRLFALQPSPVIRLNAIIALSYDRDTATALPLLEELESESRLTNYQPLFAAKADMLRRNGQYLSAMENYKKAISLTKNAVERRFLESRLKAAECQLS